MIRDKGLQTQYKKFRFADLHWNDFSQLNDETLRRFKFIYLRPSFQHAFGRMNKEELDPHLRCMETAIVRELDPPCNDRSANSDGTPGASSADAEASMRTLMNDYAAQFH